LFFIQRLKGGAIYISDENGDAIYRL